MILFNCRYGESDAFQSCVDWNLTLCYALSNSCLKIDITICNLLCIHRILRCIKNFQGSNGNWFFFLHRRNFYYCLKVTFLHDVVVTRVYTLQPMFFLCMKRVSLRNCHFWFVIFTQEMCALDIRWKWNQC